MSTNFFEGPTFLRAALQQLPAGVYIVDSDRHIRFWNRGAERIVGHLAHEVVGRMCTDHAVEACDVLGQPLNGDACPVSVTLRNGHPRQLTANFLHKEGHRVPVAIRCQPIVSHNDTVEGVIVLFEELAVLNHGSGAPSHFGFLDETTGVPAQRLTRAVLAESMSAMEESRRGFGLLRVRVLGLDEFRSRHGPHSIAPFLRTTAHTLRHSLEATTFLGRWGEDEFIAVLPLSSAVAVAAAAATAWSRVTSSEVRWWGDRFPVQAVVMHAVAQPGDKIEKLLNGLEPAHAAAAGRAIGAHPEQNAMRAAHSTPRG